MIMRLPITFDRSITINYSDGSSEKTKIFPANKGLVECTFIEINGWDVCHNRVTNLVGYDGIEMAKKCPRCNITKHVTRFGYDGRYTNRRRDQSYCNECRGSY
ncbi:MAG: hypothetical protein ACLKAK_10850 [Alkaliphilus sp.]